MLEEEYQLEYFQENGLVRKVCTNCGSAFWTRDPDRAVCGDAPCEPYSFIGNPVFRQHTVDEMREAFLSFFEQNGHTRMDRYPVVARWRDDIYLTIASIADFQPYRHRRESSRRRQTPSPSPSPASASTTWTRWDAPGGT